MRLSDNHQLYDYLVAMSIKLNNRGAVELSRDVAAASRLVATIPDTEFLGESRIALRLRGHVKSGQRWSPENRPTEVAGD